MKVLKLGSLTLPLEIITMRTAIYGTSGSGKTSFARLAAEQVHATGHRFCALDLKNDWYGLKSSADGSAAGVPVVIFGGPRRDVQIFDDGGAAVADTIAAIEQSAIVDLDALSKGKQLKFLIAFLERLYDVNRSPLILFADEADRYAPQKPMDNLGPIALGASEDICRRGRKRGIGSMWITQRTAVINKNITQICDLAVVFRTPGGIDLKELEKDVGRIVSKEETAEVIRMAPGLENGQAIFLSSHPRLRKILPRPPMPIQLPLPWTFDSSATPGLGQRRREPKVLAQADLAAIEDRMKAQVERAKADDPAELRKQVATLKRQVAELEKRPAAAAPAPKTERVEVPVLKNGQLTQAHKLVERFAAISEKNRQTADKAFEIAGKLATSINAKMTTATPAAPPRPVPVAPRPIAPPAPVPIRRPAAEAREADEPAEPYTKPFPFGEKQVLGALIQFPAGLRREQITVLTGYKRRSANDYILRLRQRGYVIESGDKVLATDEGKAALPDAEPLPTGDALQQYWLTRLPQGERVILQALLQAYPEAVERAQVVEQTGYKPRSANDYLLRLRAKELVVEPSRSSVQASKELFE